MDRQMVQINPDLAWYTSISERKGLHPRCPYASVYRCPRFFQSLSLLGSAGSTEIDPNEDKKLLDKWKNSDLWPVTKEQATAIAGSEGRMKHFWNFCPEVAFERFGWFASHLDGYADEIDIDLAHSKLGKEGAGPADWRWIWANISPIHYSECPLYSPLACDYSVRSPTNVSQEPTQEAVIDLKPNFLGFGLNLNALITRIARWWLRWCRSKS